MLDFLVAFWDSYDIMYDLIWLSMNSDDYEYDEMYPTEPK